MVHRMSSEEYREYCDEYCGICLECGAIRWGDTEPDAEAYACDECGQNKVVGIENAMIMGAIDFTDEVTDE